MSMHYDRIGMREPPTGFLRELEHRGHGFIRRIYTDYSDYSHISTVHFEFYDGISYRVSSEQLYHESRGGRSSSRTLDWLHYIHRQERERYLHDTHRYRDLLSPDMFNSNIMPCPSSKPKKKKRKGIDRLRHVVDKWLKPVHKGLIAYQKGEEYELGSSK